MTGPPSVPRPLPFPVWALVVPKPVERARREQLVSVWREATGIEVEVMDAFSGDLDAELPLDLIREFVGGKRIRMFFQVRGRRFCDLGLARWKMSRRVNDCHSFQVYRPILLTDCKAKTFVIEYLLEWFTRASFPHPRSTSG